MNLKYHLWGNESIHFYPSYFDEEVYPNFDPPTWSGRTLEARYAGPWVKGLKSGRVVNSPWHNSNLHVFLEKLAFPVIHMT
jgi:hypothetical protein